MEGLLSKEQSFPCSIKSKIENSSSSIWYFAWSKIIVIYFKINRVAWARQINLKFNKKTNSKPPKISKPSGLASLGLKAWGCMKEEGIHWGGATEAENGSYKLTHHSLEIMRGGAVENYWELECSEMISSNLNSHENFIMHENLKTKIHVC